MMNKILFASSEVHPLIKTGGLADVAGSLPIALAELGQDIRIIMPRYDAIKLTEPVIEVSRLRVNNCDVVIQETQLPDSSVKVWLVDYPEYFGKPGNPYVDQNGEAWPDSAEKFALFCRISTEVATNRAGLDWKADLVHCNDWQTGLIPALLSLESNPPASIFTIHNMAYQGLFDSSTFSDLNLPGKLWKPSALEYFGQLSFIKGGLAFANRITTVSPTYAEEIQTAEFGYGLEGLLQYRQDSLSGIINGIDTEIWNPSHDSALAKSYSIKTLADKQLNKTALQQSMGLPVDSQIPVFGLIGRLVEQKGIDLVIACLESMCEHPLQFVLLGSGEKHFESALQALAKAHPTKIAIKIGYNETLAHQIEAGSDVFLMPSRFEPCGLNQMYSQRYGTLPIVRRTGGLADTVTDSLPSTIQNGTASGIVFDDANASALMEAIKRTLFLFENKAIWQQIQRTAMSKDFSWQNSAQQYLDLYQSIIA